MLFGKVLQVPLGKRDLGSEDDLGTCAMTIRTLFN